MMGSSDEIRMPQHVLSEVDQQIIESIACQDVNSVLRNWVVQDEICRDALAASQLELPDEIPLNNAVITDLSFVRRSNDRGSTVVKSSFDVFTAGDDGQLKVSGEYPIGKADLVIQQRIVALFELLRSGVLRASAEEGDIRANNWSRIDGVLLVSSSDLVFSDHAFHSVAFELPGPAQAAKALRRGGRPPKYDWDSVNKIVVTIANSPDGLPEIQAELIRMIQDKYAATHDGAEPSDSHLKEALKRLLPDDYPGRK